MTETAYYYDLVAWAEDMDRYLVDGGERPNVRDYKREDQKA